MVAAFSPTAFQAFSPLSVCGNSKGTLPLSNPVERDSCFSPRRGFLHPPSTSPGFRCWRWLSMRLFRGWGVGYHHLFLAFWGDMNAVRTQRFLGFPRFR